MKKLVLTFILLLSLLLVACGEKEVVEPVDNEKISFENKMSFLNESNSYKLNIVIKDNDTFIETKIAIDFDGKKSMYVDEDYVVYYEDKDNKTIAYYQTTDGFEVVEEELSQKDFYYNFKYEDFINIGESYLLDSEKYSSINTFFGIEEGKMEVSSVVLKFNESGIDHIKFNIKIDGSIYLTTLTFSNIGTTQVTLPKVGA